MGDLEVNVLAVQPVVILVRETEQQNWVMGRRTQTPSRASSRSWAQAAEQVRRIQYILTKKSELRFS